MIKAVFFDLDNTLTDWRDSRKAIHFWISKEFGKRFDELFSKVEYEFVGKTLDPLDYNVNVWFKETFRRLKIEISESKLKRLEKKYWDIGLKKMKKGVALIKVLTRLKKYKLIMVTDSDGYLNNHIKNKKLSILGIRKYFDLIVTSNDTGKNKPDLELWRRGLKKFNLKGDECFMVGDKPEMDLAPAKKLGMQTIWIKVGKWSAMRKRKKFKYVDHEITRLEQVLKYVN